MTSRRLFTLLFGAVWLAAATTFLLVSLHRASRPEQGTAAVIHTAESPGLPSASPESPAPSPGASSNPQPTSRSGQQPASGGTPAKPAPTQAGATPSSTAPTPSSAPPSPSSAPTPPPLPPPSTQIGDTAHLMHSINIGEYGCGDPFISNAGMRQIVASHHIPYIRAPFRESCTDSQILEMLDAIVSVGAVPQVIVDGNCTNNTVHQAASDHWLALTDQAVASGVYWVEYGNEEDIGCGTGGISVQQYVAGWNRDVPIFRAHHPRARFIGPVTAGHNQTWIDTLLASGSPKPDAVSWHWYPCGGGATTSQCLTHTAGIDNDVLQTDAYESQVGVHAPIWITEWDEDYTDDGRFSDQAFIQSWLALAMQHLENLHNTANLAVAEFYVLTNGVATSPTQLVYPPPSDSYTYVGAAFFSAVG